MNPVALSYGPFTLRYSYLIALLMILICYSINMVYSKKTKANLEKADSLFWLMGISALLGGRIAFVLSHINYFHGRWFDLITPWLGAFTLWGAIVGVYIAYLITNKRDSKTSQSSLAVFTFILPIFLAGIQWGLFFEGDGWGRVALGFGTIEVSGLSRYPLWLYRSIGYLIIAFFIFTSKNLNLDKRFINLIGYLGLLNIALYPLEFFPSSVESFETIASNLLFILLWFFRSIYQKRSS